MLYSMYNIICCNYLAIVCYCMYVLGKHILQVSSFCATPLKCIIPQFGKISQLEIFMRKKFMVKNFCLSRLQAIINYCGKKILCV